MPSILVMLTLPVPHLSEALASTAGLAICGAISCRALPKAQAHSGTAGLVAADVGVIAVFWSIIAAGGSADQFAFLFLPLLIMWPATAVAWIVLLARTTTRFDVAAFGLLLTASGVLVHVSWALREILILLPV